MKALRGVLGGVALLGFGVVALSACELFLPESSKACDTFCTSFYDVTCATRAPGWEREICPSFCTILDDSKAIAAAQTGKDCDLAHTMFDGSKTDGFCRVVHDVCGADAGCTNVANDYTTFECRTKWLEVSLFWKRQGGCDAQIAAACKQVSSQTCAGVADPATCK